MRQVGKERKREREICMPESAALSHLVISHSDDIQVSHYHIHNVCIKTLVYDLSMRLS